MKLAEDHPDLKKFNQLIELAEKLEIVLHFANGMCWVSIGNKEYRVEDIETNQYVFQFPNCSKTKLTYEKEQDDE